MTTDKQHKNNKNNSNNNNNNNNKNIIITPYNLPYKL
jgi:hypothetical protein